MHVEPAQRGVVVLAPRLERPARSRRRRPARAPCALLQVGRSSAEQRGDQLLVVDQRGLDVRRVAAGDGRDGGTVHGRGGGAAARRSPARAGVVRTDAGQRRRAHLACGEGRCRPGRRCTRRPGPWRGTGRSRPARFELAGRSRMRSAQCWWISCGLHAFTAQCRSHAIGVHGLAPYRAAHRSAGAAGASGAPPPKQGTPLLSTKRLARWQRRAALARVVFVQRKCRQKTAEPTLKFCDAQALPR